MSSLTVMYDGEIVGEITTNRSISLEEALEILGIDIYELQDPDTPRWDNNSFDMVYFESSL